jgi:hypothetical protein
MSFTDKLSNGVAVALLQQFSPCPSHSTNPQCNQYYKYIMTLFPAGGALITLVFLVILYVIRPKNRRSKKLKIGTFLNAFFFIFNYCHFFNNFKDTGTASLLDSTPTENDSESEANDLSTERIPSYGLINA